MQGEMSLVSIRCFTMAPNSPCPSLFEGIMQPWVKLGRVSLNLDVLTPSHPENDGKSLAH